ncbi:hypothetical protein FNF27_05182 [Cafeteria roenbergensis]|uniref:Uncharacterized protein n=1 Tax=Cafeteria roenbergensis TaxID=33653 RepID=A0A5A8E6I7_CAFRO|nr:hypothetical protein FNF27_05182 [Cafeteria roenbergensis]
MTPTPSVTASSTPAPSVTRTPSTTSSRAPSPTSTRTPTPTASVTPSPSPSASSTGTSTPSPSPSATPSPTASRDSVTLAKPVADDDTHAHVFLDGLPHVVGHRHAHWIADRHPYAISVLYCIAQRHGHGQPVSDTHAFAHSDSLTVILIQFNPHANPLFIGHRHSICFRDCIPHANSICHRVRHSVRDALSCSVLPSALG